jgi:NAD(P) transhydrogenase subunit alpha
VNALLVSGEVARVLIAAETVRGIRPGSVIVDVAIDQGGNCALTKPGALHTVDDVLICGTKNIPGSLPVHATWLYANNMYYFVENLFKKKKGEIDFDDEIVASATVTRDGRIVHAGILKAMGKEA